MRIARQGLVILPLLMVSISATQTVTAQSQPAAGAPNLQSQSEQLFVLANQARAAQGIARLQWDPALAAAALQHCRRMVAEGPIAHRYGGEPDLTARAGDAGAHFSLIEENVALGAYAATIHDSWMHSPGHRANLLNPDVDRVGIAVVPANGVLYAVADYARAVPVLAQAQVEASIARLLRAKGMTILKDVGDARAYCANASKGNSGPGFLMRWQNADLTVLPQPLLDRLASGRYRQAAVGSCAPQDVEGSFTTYRVAVLLY
jgi:uncharacterized protein YkwD